MQLIAFDPGQSTGWAVLRTANKSGIVEKFGVTRTPEKLFEVLDEYGGVDLAICEDYIINPAVMRKGFTHAWDKGLTLRAIGAIQFWCREHNIEFVLQQPSTKPAGYGFMGATYVKGKAGQHHLDAIAHGVYYCVKNKLLTPGDFRGASV